MSNEQNPNPVELENGVSSVMTQNEGDSYLNDSDDLGFDESILDELDSEDEDLLDNEE
jgi:hypothetical protein